MAKLGRDRDGGLSDQIAGAVSWLAHKRSVPREVAEEAVQEALLQLLQLAVGMRPASFEGWLRRVAERRLVDMQRHLDTQVGPSSGMAEIEQAIQGPDLDAVMLVRSSLRSLDRELRSLVVLRMMGAAWSEVAALTGLREDAARKRFERALVELRALMGDAARA
ncbi:MAG TPA: sigma factor [Microbacteriaceae bacterium]|jgi:DNA-directed RNA polymerase specialized sigma24 family protein|nr:sigma factor [Microbacteriaceae bacterium]